MSRERIPQPGQIYNHFKNKLYQIITLAYDAETGESMVVYQALYGEFKTYIRAMESFLSEVDHVKYPEVTQKYRFELRMPKEENVNEPIEAQKENTAAEAPAPADNTEVNGVNAILLQFLDAESFYKKLEVITANRKHMNDRIINDMAVSLDCAVDEGPLDDRIQGLIYCLQAMCRFEDKRLR